MELLGREAECRLLDEFVAALRDSDGGRALHVIGEPGVGKTALLDHLAGTADGLLVLRVAGVQAERELAFAALHQLVAGHLDDIDRLPAPQRAALRTAFGVDVGPVPNRFVIALGILQLLTQLGTARPVLCIVDDMQWVDRASAQALIFVVRRLADQRIGVVTASRRPSDAATGSTLHVTGLPMREAGVLLDKVVNGRLDQDVRRRLLIETGGNPLALTELPQGLSAAEMAGGFTLPSAVPLSSRIEAMYRGRLDSVPAAARQWLIIAAADAVGNPTTLWEAVRHAGLDRTAGELALGTGLVEIDTMVRFRHPLARSAVYQAAAPQERRAAHRALAAATDPETDPDRRAWHRAAAVAYPDDDVAAELESAAGRARARGGHTAAAAFLERAAMATAAPAQRAHRMLAAAEAHRESGSLSRIPTLLDAVGAQLRDGRHRGRVTRIRGQVALELHDRVAAVDLLIDAARLLAADAPQEANAAYLEALFAAIWGGAADGMDIARIANAMRLPLTPHNGETLVECIFRGMRTCVVKGYAAAAPILRDAVEMMGSDESLQDATSNMFRARLSLPLELWDDEAWRSLTRRYVGAARDQGAVTMLLVALDFLAINQIFEGDLDAAAASLAEADALTSITGTSTHVMVDVVLAAWRGDEARVAALSAEVRQRDQADATLAAFLADYARAVLGNAEGRFDAALEAAWPLFARGQFTVSPLVVSEVVDSAAHLNARTELLAAVDWLTVRAESAPGDWVHGVTRRARALAEIGDIEGDYCASIAHLRCTRGRGELARTHLVYGEWLRRQGRRRDAREHLRRAQEIFIALDASGFARRAERELRALGYSGTDRKRFEGQSLTAQEAQIAALARIGMSNPEIAQRLYISPRTVQYHLRKVFIKLKISSREHLTSVSALDHWPPPVHRTDVVRETTA